MVDLVRPQLRDRPVEAKLEEIQELLNREHGPVISQLRERFNELVTLFSPGEAVASAGAQVGYLQVTLDGTEYSIPLYERS